MNSSRASSGSTRSNCTVRAAMIVHPEQRDLLGGHHGGTAGLPPRLGVVRVAGDVPRRARPTPVPPRHRSDPRAGWSRRARPRRPASRRRDAARTPARSRTACRACPGTRGPARCAGPRGTAARTARPRARCGGRRRPRGNRGPSALPRPTRARIGPQRCPAHLAGHGHAEPASRAAAAARAGPATPGSAGSAGTPPGTCGETRCRTTPPRDPRGSARARGRPRSPISGRRTGRATPWPCPAPRAGTPGRRRWPSAAAITSISARQPCRSPSTIIRASRGSTGSAASDRPVAVSVKPPSGLRFDGAELTENRDAVGDSVPVRRVEEREGPDVAQLQRRHLQDHRGKGGTGDLGIGETRPGLEVRQRVQPDAHAVLEPAAAARPLPRGGLRNPFDGQPLHLRARRVSGDARRTWVDHVPDARNRERCLGDVGGEHDPTAGVRREHPMLLGRGQPPEQRQRPPPTRAGPPGGRAERRRCR